MLQTGTWLAPGFRHPLRRSGRRLVHTPGDRARPLRLVPMIDLHTVTPLVLSLGDALRAKGWRLAAAESCTGGLIAAACTSVAGSSDWFERGFVTYSNTAKCEQLGIDAAVIGTHGAVSEAVVEAMVIGALAHSP